MCNEHVVQEIDGIMKWVRLAIGGGGKVVGDFDPEDPEVVQFTSQPQHGYHVLPDGVGPVIRLDEDGRFEYVEMRWGLPSSTRRKASAPPVTKVRNLNSPFWRNWLEPQYRCLVPVSTFCEWTDARSGDGKVVAPMVPAEEGHAFHVRRHLAGMGGKWGTKARPVTGKHLLYAFITTEPNGIVGAIHSKAMPAILTRDKWMDWLAAQASARIALHLRPQLAERHRGRKIPKVAPHPALAIRVMAFAAQAGAVGLEREHMHLVPFHPLGLVYVPSLFRRIRIAVASRIGVAFLRMISMDRQSQTAGGIFGAATSDTAAQN